MGNFAEMRARGLLARDHNLRRTLYNYTVQPPYFTVDGGHKNITAK